MAQQWFDFCSVGDIPVGQREVFDTDIASIILFNVEGQFYAVENLCSHENYELAEGELEACILKCPKHGATFDIRTGQHLSAPAYFPITIYPSRIEGNAVQVLLNLP
jgi:3-phenylpropionate/trans-cinnamate dioxygenase ferredoxin component